MTFQLIENIHADKQRLHAWIVMAVLLAVLLRSVIPAGFMPNLRGNQSFEIVICTMSGPQTILVDKNFNPHKGSNNQESGDRQNSLCSFSVNTAFAEIHYIPLTSINVSFDGKVALTPVNQYKASSHFFGNSSSRAPPVLSYA